MASWFAYKYLNAMRGNEIPSADEAVLASADGRKTAGQLQKLQTLTADQPEVDREVSVGPGRLLQWTLPMRSNDIVLLTLEPAKK